MAVFFTRRGAPPSLGTRLGDLEVGTIVFIKENGVYQDYLVVHQGLPSSMYDSSCNGTWLLRKDPNVYRAWSDSNNDYKNSIIHSYLNETFLNLFDDDIKNTIKQVRIPYQNGTGSRGSVASGANGLSCKIFLLSGYELGWTTSDTWIFPRDGAKLSYFDSGTSTSANNKRIAYLNGSGTNWWLRSPDKSDDISAFGVYYHGNYGSWDSYYRDSVRPALIMPSDLLVDDNNNILV